MCISSFLDGLDLCPDELKPSKLLTIDSVIPISARSMIEVEKVKQEVRSILDLKAEEEQQRLEQSDREANLREKLRERGPKVV